MGKLLVILVVLGVLAERVVVLGFNGIVDHVCGNECCKINQVLVCNKFSAFVVLVPYHLRGKTRRDCSLNLLKVLPSPCPKKPAKALCS
jgi:hypothetical protein